MKLRLSLSICLLVLIITAPLVAYTINLDGKSQVALTPEEQEVLAGANPKDRIELEEKAIESERERALSNPRQNIIYLNGKPQEEWPK